MDLNIRREIILSYEKLISDCKISIEKGVEVDKNKNLIKDYSRILEQVKRKPKNAYDDVIEEMKRVSIKENMLKTIFKV